ncbi:cell division protein SepF [Neofamilia massiliensis]|uniref:cell division protein SepF n=1 Tax=Neofamilia massiliensis TaxID=1673724 RepID=UPI0006BB94D9|nr:cell division protein SepF [Neofamilia massiliensis]
MEKIKNFFGLGDEFEEGEDLYEAEPTPVNEIEEDTTSSYQASERQTSRSKSKAALNLHSSGNIQMKICIHEPLSYDEAPLIVDDLRLRKAVVLNFEQLDINVKRQIFDFVNGALYALDGKIQKVNRDIFILAPSNIEIDGLKAELQEKGVFPW